MASGEMSPAEFTNFLANALTAMAANCIDGAIGYVWMDWRQTSELLRRSSNVQSSSSRTSASGSRTTREWALFIAVSMNWSLY